MSIAGRRKSQLPPWLKDAVENDGKVRPVHRPTWSPPGESNKRDRGAKAGQAASAESKTDAVSRERAVSVSRGERRESTESRESEPSSPAPVQRGSSRESLTDRSELKEKDRTNVQVCVRIRPMNDREKEASDAYSLSTRSSTGSERLDTINFSPLDEEHKPEDERKEHTFQFDWVLQDVTQQDVYLNLGQHVVYGVAEGFHGCVFAYGQTGSGKSHSIFGGGSAEERGLLPRIAEQLFSELKQTEKDGPSVVKASYLEIYNEKVRDLLRPPKANEDAKNMPSLEVRQHPKVGVFVEGLTQNIANGEQDIMNLLDFGHKIRIVGATNMNMHSSRSHAVVTLHIERTISEGGRKKKRRAQLHVVDLAGSERLAMAGTAEIRQKESKHINTSLWALGLMINGLAAQSEAGKSGPHAHVPYRNSKLTYLLSESLMGNCKTVMLACVSPASSSLNMSEQTLRFASRAKCIQTKPTRNEELEGSLVGSLRSEIELLKKKLVEAVAPDRKTDIQGQIETIDLLHKQVSMTKEEIAAQSRAFEQQRGETLQSLGLSTIQAASAWVRGESLKIKHDADPYLVNVCDDPLLSGCLTYTLELGEVLHVGSDPSCKIQIDGLGVQPEMCQIVNHDGLNIEVMMPSCAFAKPLQSDDSAVRGEGDRVTFVDERRKGLSHTHSVRSEDLEPVEEDSALMSKGRRPSKSIDDEAAVEHNRSRKRRSSGLWKGGGPGQVFVNNNYVSGKAALHHNDRLRIGRAHVFAVFVPMETLESNKRGGGKSRATTIANEIAAADSASEAASFLAREYAQQLQERIGGERAASVLAAMHEVQPLIEEANDLTDEIRGGEDFEYQFKAQILTDVTSTADDPAVTVALYKVEKPDDVTRSWALSKKPQNELVAVWSVPKFKLRLDAMRDVYHMVSEREEPWGLGDDPDPWGESAVIPFADGTSADGEGRGKHSEAELKAVVEAAQEDLRVQHAEELRFQRREFDVVKFNLQRSDADRHRLREVLMRAEQELGVARAELAARDADVAKQIEAWVYEQSTQWEWRDVLSSLRGRLETLRDLPSPRSWMEASDVLRQEAVMCGGGEVPRAPATRRGAPRR